MRPIGRLKPQNSIRRPTVSATSSSGSVEERGLPGVMGKRRARQREGILFEVSKSLETLGSRFRGVKGEELQIVVSAPVG